LLKLHIYRCTADASACRAFYEALTKPDETFLQWRQIMLKRQPAKQVFVQPNTMVKLGHVVIKEYEATVEGMIQSWAERMDMLEFANESYF
jgi:dipeptidyl-peptidase-3